MQEILWYGRGGQGVVLAAQILAESAFLQGYRGVTSAPMFGPERRGAPLTASTRISPESIRIVSQIEAADISVVLDESLIDIMNVTGRTKKRGLLIINTARTCGDFTIDGDFRIAVVDAARIAREKHMFFGGLPTMNTPLLGALARASGIISLDYIEKGLKMKMPDTHAYSNFEAIKTAFERTRVTQEGT